MLKRWNFLKTGFCEGINLDHFENERKELYEVLEDEEDIEFLINGHCILVDEARKKSLRGRKSGVSSPRPTTGWSTYIAEKKERSSVNCPTATLSR